MPQRTAWIAVDWGTSNLRAWGIDAGGTVVFARESALGMGRLAPAEFAPAFLALVADLPLGTGLEVLVCGMAGARRGWAEAPYLEAPADLRALMQAAVAAILPGGGFSVRILPGVCQKTPGAENVMRGEETQLLGLSRLMPGYSGVVCMPGTHSKWAMLDGHRIERFTTAMTGELFEMLAAHTVLSHTVGGPEAPESPDGAGAGLDAGTAQPEKLTALLFHARAAAILSGRAPGWCRAFLGGLLIGAEVAGHRDWLGPGPVPVVGSPRLCRLYGDALARLGVASAPVDAADATLAGLKAARAFAS